MRACLLELSQYHFPNVALKQLEEHPYYNYTQMYYNLSSHLEFFRGFVKPSSTLKAKIYRAMHLAYAKQPLSDEDFIIFTSEGGLIIKCHASLNKDFAEVFDKHLDEPDSCVFIPEGCEQLDYYEFPYYRKLLLNFAQNIPQLFDPTDADASVLTFSANNPDFLFIACAQAHDIDLQQLWKEYLDGGLLRKCTLSLNMLPSALQTFDWNQRHHFEVKDNKIIMVVKCTPLKEWAEKQKQFKLSEEDFTLIELSEKIQNTQEAFGLLRTLQKAQVNVDVVVPLVGTSYIFSPTKEEKKITSILEEVSEITSDLEGIEVFTQMPFDEMNSWALNGLTEVPSGNRYSYLHLIEYGSTVDPLTRGEYPPKFIEQLQKIHRENDGLFMYGFPPVTFDPQLITTEEAGFLQCQLEWSSKQHVFWRIPDLRQTEYAAITMQAIQILVIKWTDRSLFKGFHPETCMDIALTFHPKAYYVFKETKWSQDEHEYEQARKLKEQVAILESIR